MSSLHGIVGHAITAVSFTLDYIELSTASGTLRIYSNAILDTGKSQAVLGRKGAAAAFSSLAGSTIGQVVMHPTHEIVLELDDGRKVIIPLDRGSRSPTQAASFLAVGQEDQEPTESW